MSEQFIYAAAEYINQEFLFYFQVLIRLITGFIIVLVYFYISGRTQLSQINSIDMIGNFIFGGIIGGAIYSDQGSFVHYFGILALAAAVLTGVNYVSRKSYFFRSIAIGHPIPIIKDGQFLMDNILNKSNKVDMLNITSQLNAQGIHSFEDIYFAQIEPSGVVSAICDRDKLPSTIIISRGQIYFDELKSIGKTEKDLRADMARRGLKELGDIYLAEYKSSYFRYITNKGQVYPKKKAQKISAETSALRIFARHAAVNRFRRRLPENAPLPKFGSKLPPAL